MCPCLLPDNWDELVLDDHRLFVVVVRERGNVQKRFRDNIVNAFVRQDTEQRGVLK